MAGRGKGRGKGFSFDIQNLGFSRVDEVLQTSNAPPPLFSPLVSKPQPLCKSERVDSRAEILKKLLERQNEDPYGISAASKVLSQNDAERYSERFKPKSYDKYKWDRRLFPNELFNEKPKKKKSNLKSNIQNAKVKPAVNGADIEKQLQKLEEKDDTTATEQNKEEDEQDSEQGSDAINEDDDLDDDELLEESADYVSSYFDNGEGYLDEDENLDDDAVY